MMSYRNISEMIKNKTYSYKMNSIIFWKKKKSLKSTPIIETIFKEQKIHKVTEDCYTFGKLGRTQPGKKKP